MSWGTELWDQFDNLEKHTQWGIDVLEKYIKFVKERTEIELSYAKQLRNLSKKYQPKKNSKEEEEYRYTSTRAFLATLNEMNDYAGQHEVISENMTSLITAELTRYVQELKQERKSHFHDGRKAQQHIETCWKQLEASKRRFERDCKEADRAQQYFEKMDADINVTKADVEKARQQAQLRHQMAEDSKAEYSSTLQKFNSEQHEHYYTHIPNIFQKIQEMEERRIVRIGESMKTFAEVDRQVIPIIGKCLDEITKAAESVDHKNDSQMVIEAFKSGFEPPGDVDFEDFTQPMKRTVSESSLSNSRGDGKSEPKFGSKSKGKLWPFIKKNKLMSLLTSPHQPPPPPPASASPSAVPNGPQSPKQQKEPLSHRFNEFMTSKPKIHCFRSLKRGLSLKLGAGPEDFSNLPPEQRRKKLQQKVDELNRDIQKEMDSRDALTKMKDVYIKNPQMGDAASVDHRLAELGQNIEKLRLEVQKFEGWLAEVEGRLPARSEQPRRQSGVYEAQNASGVNSCAQDRESPDGSYTEEQSQETEMKVPATDFDDEFDDEEPLPTIGTCKALYTFEGQNEGTISVAEGEMLYVIEEDKGDGWTRIRRNEDEEGYVPTSYVEVYLDKNAKDVHKPLQKISE
ncbi:formin-binding protein 1 isoform X8 [Ammospiza nelsoni]|uniref:formin-binding protein 1 isoform X9 n=1 Tax=Melozone crissalis TaxID=40204 RepID=UPI000393F961|nr:formin-binding protein 1 isoform X13 [Zonotrichia albicollis]XP_054140016.1 formin-binding protein 1 isoform X9 [Melozone crissalis]XP_057894408.1 formin-binding protein 1 isoform X9 [Melospiza georgiana]XP_059342395.1 formin-binding protein 1 isoform X8 [Ammospiza nelsoni]